jgi:hypothetical protein
LGDFPLREEPIRNTALVEYLDRACMQATCSQSSELLIRAPLDDGNVNARQCQLGCQHQSRWTCANDHDFVFHHKM